MSNICASPLKVFPKDVPDWEIFRCIDYVMLSIYFNHENVRNYKKTGVGIRDNVRFCVIQI